MTETSVSSSCVSLTRPGFLVALLLAAGVAVLSGSDWPLLEGTRQRYSLLRQAVPAHLAVPVDGVAPSGIADTWGAPRSGGRRHQGVDIFARRGTEVLASTPGIVMRCGTNELGGNTVWLLGPGGERHYYAHLDHYGPVEPGSWVDAGHVIGYVGNTGNARTTPPHLHYGVIRPGRGWVNPYPRLSR